MGWRDLVQAEEEQLVLPWTGTRSLRSSQRTWTIEGRLPLEHSWNSFAVMGRKVRWIGPAAPRVEILKNLDVFYLVADRVVPTNAVIATPQETIHTFEQAHLLEEGLDRFALIRAGRVFEGGPLIYAGLEMPLGPEADVLNAFLDRAESVDHIRHVPPALDAAFRLESWQRAETDRRRVELERLRQEEERQRLLAERRAEIARTLGDGVGRRQLAATDFEGAARAALAVGGAEYLDHRRAARRGEMIVRFRLAGRRFECICEETTLRIVEAGICLKDENTGEVGDRRFVLESLPGVIREAIDQDVLVIFRHVD